MPVTLIGVSSCHYSLMVVLSANFCIYQHLIWLDGRRCEVADCLGSDSTMRNYAVQLVVPIWRTAALWWTWQSAILTVEFHILWFQGLVLLHVDSIQNHILRVYNEILKSWNNECIEYKVEHSDSIQKHNSKALYNEIFQSLNNECVEYKVERGSK
jgi:hypothetical protein